MDSQRGQDLGQWRINSRRRYYMFCSEILPDPGSKGRRSCPRLLIQEKPFPYPEGNGDQGREESLPTSEARAFLSFQTPTVGGFAIGIGRRRVRWYLPLSNHPYHFIPIYQGIFGAMYAYGWQSCRSPRDLEGTQGASLAAPLGSGCIPTPGWDLSSSPISRSTLSIYELCLSQQTVPAVLLVACGHRVL